MKQPQLTAEQLLAEWTTLRKGIRECTSLLRRERCSDASDGQPELGDAGVMSCLSAYFTSMDIEQHSNVELCEVCQRKMNAINERRVFRHKLNGLQRRMERLYRVESER